MQTALHESAKMVTADQHAFAAMMSALEAATAAAEAATRSATRAADSGDSRYLKSPSVLKYKDTDQHGDWVD